MYTYSQNTDGLCNLKLFFFLSFLANFHYDEFFSTREWQGKPDKFGATIAETRF